MKIPNYVKLYDVDVSLNRTSVQGKSGQWHNARPIQYHNFLYRLQMAWDVLRYRADALYWTINND